MSKNNSFFGNSLSGWTTDTSEPYVIKTNEDTKLKVLDSRMIPIGSLIEDTERVGK